MFELFLSLLFIFLGIYGTINYKKENKEALGQRKKLNKLILGRELKVGHSTEKLSEYMTLLVSIVFLILGLINLYRFIVSY